MSKTGLGKGLRALISESSTVDTNNSIEISPDKITPNPYQPRRTYDQETLNELASSIRIHGIIQPLIVRRKGDGYELVAGERRLRASKIAGLSKVPVIIKDFDDNTMMKVALIENIQREDLNPIDIAIAYKRLRDEFGMTQEELAEAVGNSRSAVANTLRLNNLPESIKGHVSRGTLSMGHVRPLLVIEDTNKQENLAEYIIAHTLSVRQTEELVKKALENGTGVSRETKKMKSKKQDPNVIDVEDKLRIILGTQVRIKSGKNKGVIEIEYYTQDDLNRIVEQFMN